MADNILSGLLPEITLDISTDELRRHVELCRSEKVLIEHHPLGFFRLPLTTPDRLKDGFYLHVWPSADFRKQDERSEVHCHIFDLFSRVLSGSLVDRRYVVTDDPNGSFVVSDVLYVSGQSSRVPTESRASLRLFRSYQFDAGSIYELPKGIFHKTDVLRFPTATLMRKLNVNSDATPKNLAPLGAQEIRFDHMIASQDFAWEAVMKSAERWIPSNASRRLR